MLVFENYIVLKLKGFFIYFILFIFFIFSLLGVLDFVND